MCHKTALCALNLPSCRFRLAKLTGRSSAETPGVHYFAGTSSRSRTEDRRSAGDAESCLESRDTASSGSRTGEDELFRHTDVSEEGTSEYDDIDDALILDLDDNIFPDI